MPLHEESSTISSHDELKSLIFKRGLVKSKLTRFKTFLESLPTGGSLTQLKLRLSNVQDCLSEFEDLQSQIECIDPTEPQTAERESFESLYFGLIAKAEEHIESQLPVPQHSTQNTVGNPNTVTPITTAPQIRLPSIDLPTFSGKYEDWISFSDSFKALIHQNETLTDIQRLHYLKSSLKHDAAHVLKSLELSATNYSVAWGLLQERYQNRRLIIDRHVKALHELPQVERESAQSLRQLVDGTLLHMRALKALNEPTEHWDTLVRYLVTSKLNPSISREWENSTKPDEVPSLKELIDFLLRKCQILETCAQATKFNNPSTATVRHNKFTNNKQTLFVSHTNPTCSFCKGNHPIYQCQELLSLSHEQRMQAIKQSGICFNCLRPGHSIAQCKSGGCKKCKRKHNTLLHVEKQSNEKSQPDVTIQNCHGTTNNNEKTQVMLSTALVDIIGPYGHTIQCRALLDSGSQSSFITESVVQQLRLPKQKHSITITGITGNKVNSHCSVQACMRSKVSNYSTNMPFLVVPKITSCIPADTVVIQNFKIPNNISLADPTFKMPGRIDILIGQDIFYDLLCIGQVKTTGMPTIQKTRLGWVVGGRYTASAPASPSSSCHLSTIDQLNNQLQAFWQLEELNAKKQLTTEEQLCEDHFSAHTTRDEDGRYIVSMPLKNDPSQLGDSRDVAVKRLQHVERRLARDPELRKQYTDFMREYVQLGHMEELAAQKENSADTEYYLPHHPVIKADSSTTKLRVVFDASAKTASGISLNDIQLIGPTIQSDLITIVLRFRMHTHVMTADLEKMYRQIKIDPTQRNLLQIVWRDDPSQDIKTFKLSTVTYGTACAPFLATRTLTKLAEDEGAAFPKASDVIKRDFYVDDVLTGGDTIEDCLELQGQLIQLLSKGQFNLRKWNSNSKDLLSNLPDALLESKPQEFAEGGSTRKTLGMWWDAERDVFLFRHVSSDLGLTNHLTKRSVLSEIARLFDPLGLVSPVLIRAKMYLQELWKLKLSWDESLPMQMHTQWTQFKVCLNDLNHVVIKRHTKLPRAMTHLKIHGFSDSSETAYGAAVYLKSRDSEGNVKVSLLCSKSRVAPLKVVSLPRLELCAALLLSELVVNVKQSLEIDSKNITYWTDSTVVLSWLNAEPARWSTFVANRVSKIQDNTRQGIWRHVPTGDNPADLISRGTRTSVLATCNLWWEGPTWLKEASNQWPINKKDVLFQQKIPEERSSRVASLVSSQQAADIDLSNELMNKFSSLSKIIRILAYCRRFLSNLKERKTNGHVSGPLSIDEVSRAKICLLKKVQEQSFSKELKGLTQESENGTRIKTLSVLSPFIDKDGLIRVGGRLEKSNLSYNAKHQILLPKGHRICELIASEEHVRQLHCGPQTLLYAIRQEYWPLSGRNLTRRITHKCLRCFKANPKSAQQLMGTLPSSRVNPARAFQRTGLDYCGPFYVKHSRKRGVRATKAYVAVFVCLATKAIHLEMVSDMSTDTFLGALRRFISRRGICSEIYSDNGKTFVGANRELQELRSFLTNEASVIVRGALIEGINWHFIPPYAPHMGGLWEAAVKSLKHHLQRVMGAAALTCEEFNTLLTQVEAVLNSRPLTPLSNDPSDLTVLTPAHFLTGGSLKALPEPSLSQISDQRLNRWQRVQQLLQHFWDRWQSEYLSNLQRRCKWRSSNTSIKIGTLVLLKDDHLPPLSWPMGRVTQLHPGKDNLVRVVTVKTTSGDTKRAIHKLCPLPID